MTVANNYAPIRQLGDSGTTQYSAAWSMIAAAYAVVSLESVTTGIRTVLSQGVAANQYQISITSSGFTVTLGQPATSGFYVNVSRNTGLDQTTPFRTSKGFQGEVEEASFDKLTAMVQDAKYTAGLAITIPSGETATTVLPAALVRALQFAWFDAAGNISTASGVSGTAISSAMQPVVQATTLALARTAMGVVGTADAVVLTNSFALTNNQNGTTALVVNNNSAGASASTQINLNNGTNVAQLVMTGTGAASPNAFTINTLGSERLRIDSSGRIIINNSGSPATGYTNAGDISLGAANNIRALNTAKAWVAFQGVGSISGVNGFNISSVTRTSTGIYPVNLTNALPNVNSAVCGFAGNTAPGSTNTIGDRQVSSYVFSTSQMALITGLTASATVFDTAYVGCAVFSN